ncbi:hypothetical protein LP419_36825 [Massilia sp. H-1]|nr:hypothetical protein LP419_36825 [Massilia sp. H-1]
MVSTVEANSGYDNMFNLNGGGLAAFNPFAAANTSFVKAWRLSTFTLNSLLVDGAWGSQTLTFVGLASGTTLFSTTFGVSTAPSLVNFNWAGINELRVITGNDFVHNDALA